MISTISEAIQDIKNGKMVIIIDDEDRENEGDLVCAASKISPEIINFMTKYGRGLVCVSMEEEKLSELEIFPMVTKNTDAKQTAFTVSVDYKIGTTTGISAFDRAKTVEALISKNSKKDDFTRPGHIFPLIYKKGGILVRAGHTEASVDLARLSGLEPSGVICEILNDDGSMARLPDLLKFSEKHGLKIITIVDLIKYRQNQEMLVEEVAAANLPTEFGEFIIKIFKNKIDNSEHVALIKGEIKSEENTLVRVHSSCFTGDLLGSLRCDCRNQLHKTLEMINSNGGVLVYLNQEGRGIGLGNKIKAYNLQDEGLDTVEANIALGFKEDLRDYGIGAQILKCIGVKNIKLLTNNPKKIVGLNGYGLNIVDRIPILVNPNEKNKKYLDTKKNRMGHLI